MVSSRISPLRSASGMNWSGGIRPRSGCSQRTSASTPQMPPRSSACGWYSSVSSPASMPRRRSAASASRDVCCCSRPTSCTSTPVRLRLATYMAVSACLSRVSKSGAWSGQTATPMLASSCSIIPSIANGRSSSRPMAVAMAPAPSSPTGASTANSSPPSRASIAPLRHLRLQPGGQRAQQRVAAEVAEVVVDLLELVEVEQQQGHPLGVAPADDRRLGRLPQEHPVRQPGQRVVAGDGGLDGGRASREASAVRAASTAGAAGAVRRRPAAVRRAARRRRRAARAAGRRRTPPARRARRRGRRRPSSAPRSCCRRARRGWRRSAAAGRPSSGRRPRPRRR